MLTKKHPDPKPQAPEAPKAPQPTDIVASIMVSIETRRDGTMRIELTGGGDASTLPKGDFKSRRLFLRDYTRALEQLNGYVFKGAIRSL